jgi:hypothetical protein
MPRLIQPLPDGPLDLVGDVHGEIEALLALLHRLGVDPERRRAARPVVFVGDLVDRGPDSVAVVELVAGLVDAGLAHVVLGNHELNLLLDDKKEGNGWYWGDADDHAQLGIGRVPFRSRVATTTERDHVRAFLADLPLALERPDLRVVHACWSAEAAAALPHAGDHAALARSIAAEIAEDLKAREVPHRAAAERAAFAGLKDRDVPPDRYLAAVAEEDVAHQARNPIKLLTSGAEVPVADGKAFFVGGKWRFVTRDRWWRRPVDRPTVVGHYWRRRGPPIEGKLDVWDDVPPFAWSGGVFCVDYSVGRRYAERANGRTHATGFDGGLAALRWPERVLVFDDRDGHAPTT